MNHTINGIPNSVVHKFMNTEKEREGDCVIWKGICSSNGYGNVYIDGYNYLAHRVAYALSHGSEAKDCVLHSCDVRNCVNPSHLRDGTAKMNTQEMFNRGRENRPIGEKHYRAKLTEKEVLEIRKSTASQSDIAFDYGISNQHISDIINKKRWKHL